MAGNKNRQDGRSHRGCVKSDKVLHEVRQVLVGRPIHITSHLFEDLPTLRTPEILEMVRRLLGCIKIKGVRTLAYAIMGTHLHLIAIVDEREALGNGMRVLFAQLARQLKAHWNKTRGPGTPLVGKVFSDRYFSAVGKDARTAWNAFCYVLRNSKDAGCPDARSGRCPYTEAAPAEKLLRHPFLRSLFADLGPLDRLLRRMRLRPIPYTLAALRPQPQLRLAGF